MNRLVRLVALLSAALVAVSVTVALPARAAAPAGGRFIVTLKGDADPAATAAEYHRRDGVAVSHVYTAALNGFAGDFSGGALGRLQADGRVERIEKDGVVHADSTQTGATWGLDRIDQRNLPLDSGYSYETTASNVTAYIIDTGIRFSHSEFGGRATSGYDAVDGGAADDCNGHGTHVAGTVGGATYGVAKGVHLVAVRVLDCSGSGTWSGVIAGLDWVAQNRVLPAVANMSLGGGASSSVDDAVNRVITSGVTMAVAAGNGNNAGVAQDACTTSPARVPAALTIGATTSADVKTSWSNYGSCVDLFAPGYNITSAWYSSDTATNTISGTSMATPHVTGAAALYLAANPAATPATVSDGIKAATTKDIVTSASTDANNDLLYVGSATSPSTPPATATITVTLTKSVKKGVTTVVGSWTDSGGTGFHHDVSVNTAPQLTDSTATRLSTTWSGHGTVTYDVCRTGTSICGTKSITI